MVSTIFFGERFAHLGVRETISGWTGGVLIISIPVRSCQLAGVAKTGQKKLKVYERASTLRGLLL